MKRGREGAEAGDVRRDSLMSGLVLCASRSLSEPGRKWQQQHPDASVSHAQMKNLLCIIPVQEVEVVQEEVQEVEEEVEV